MKALIDRGKVAHIYDDNFDPENIDVVFEQIKSIGFDSSLLEKNAINPDGTSKYYLDNGVLKKYTQEEIEQTPEYKEKILNELVSKEKEKMALKEVKKLRPDLSVEIDAKLAELEA